MDINMTSSTTQARGVGDSAGMAVLKKAIAIEAQNALSLIAAIPQPVQNTSNPPPHLGQNINTTA